jgi:hypothetical protein
MNRLHLLQLLDRVDRSLIVHELVMSRAEKDEVREEIALTHRKVRVTSRPGCLLRNNVRLFAHHGSATG